MAMTRDQILAIEDLPRKEITVPSWENGTVWIRTISGTERDAYMLSVRPLEGQQPDYEHYRSRLLVYAICDETGQRLFRDGEHLLIGAKCGDAINLLFEEAQKLNGLKPSAVEDARKNS